MSKYLAQVSRADAFPVTERGLVHLQWLSITNTTHDRPNTTLNYLLQNAWNNVMNTE